MILCHLCSSHVVAMEDPIPGTQIFVDFFGRPSGSAYVLTHCHTDHLRGLSAEWKYGFIHCSPVTAALLVNAIGISPRILKTHECEVPFELLDPSSSSPIVTTFVDANHIPGSTMVVFENLRDGPIVNTGDFRYDDALLKSPTLQRVALEVDGKRCQKLSLDVSWANAPFYRIPSKRESIEMFLGLLGRISQSERCFLRSSLGDEELLNAIALRHPGEKLLFTDEHRFHEIQIADPDLCRKSCILLGPDELVCHHRSRIVIIDNWRGKRDDRRLHNVHGVSVNCSTLWWARSQAQSQARVSQWGPKYDYVQNLWQIVYSMHSSKEEIERFCEFLRPLRISPICKPIVGAPDVLINGQRVGRHEEIVFETPEARVVEQSSTSDSQDLSAAALGASMRAFFHPETLTESQEELLALLADDPPCTPTLHESQETLLDPESPSPKRRR